jgi:hypothetical protein
VGLPGGPVGTENLTGVLEATMRDPSTGGPGARLATASKGQGNDGVGGQAHTHFRPWATAPLEAPLTSLAVSRRHAKVMMESCKALQ